MRLKLCAHAPTCARDRVYTIRSNLLRLYALPYTHTCAPVFSTCASAYPSMSTSPRICTYFSSPRRRPPLYKLCASAAESECTLLTVARKRRAFCDPIPAHPVYKRRRRLYKGFFPPSFSPACSKRQPSPSPVLNEPRSFGNVVGSLACVCLTVARERKREREREIYRERVVIVSCAPFRGAAFYRAFMCTKEFRSMSHPRYT